MAEKTQLYTWLENLALQAKLLCSLLLLLLSLHFITPPQPNSFPLILKFFVLFFNLIFYLVMVPIKRVRLDQVFPCWPKCSLNLWLEKINHSFLCRSECRPNLWSKKKKITAFFVGQHIVPTFEWRNIYIPHSPVGIQCKRLIGEKFTIFVAWPTNLQFIFVGCRMQSKSLIEE